MAAFYRQPEWNIYEAVILLEGYLELTRKELPRLRIIKRVSHDLRQMAINQGVQIDDKYRNENGISYQIQSMESAYKGRKIYVHSTKLFNRTVDIYRKDKEKYYELLSAAWKMINNTNQDISNETSHLEDEFKNHLLNETLFTSTTCDSCVSSIKASEKYAVDHNYTHTLLFTDIKEETLATAKELYSDPGFVSYDNEQHNIFSAAINKLLQFIGFDIPQKARLKNASNKSRITTFQDNSAGIVEIMNHHYEYGFKIDSIRELMRFRQFAEAMDITLPESDSELTATIKRSGTLIDGKVFCKSEALPEELNDIIDSIINAGINVIYYTMLFELQNDWMSSHVITSPEMLKEYLQKYVPNWHFAKTFMIPGNKQTEKKAVTAEIIRVWGDPQIRTVGSLSKDLPYIPLANIWRVISGNDNFVLAEEGSYLYTKKLIMTDEEALNIREYVESAIASFGYASLNDIPLGDIEEENYEIPHIPLLNALYKRLLSADYNLNGTIITVDSTALDAVSLLKNYLIDKEQCTFDELVNELIKLTGRINRQYTFQALYDEMIRVDKDLFVSDQRIRFNVSEIDEVISGFIKDRFVSIKEITTFAMFPVCGCSWNHFVLESYCYNFSQKFSLHLIHFNDKNVGIIAEKSFDKKYDEMLAIALARSDIDLDSDYIGQYLFNIGYLAKAKYAALDTIILQAKQIRKER